jgi:hypothetical protein
VNASVGARNVTVTTGRTVTTVRPALARGAWVLGVLTAFTAYLRLAGTRAVNSDGAAQALQAWDMLHGNVLLHGWTTSDVPFYTTELPEYLLIELVRGLGAPVVQVAAALTYTLVVLLAALVARGTATGREAVVRVALAAGIMLAPQLGAGTNVLLSSPDHIGTSVPLLALLLILDRVRASGYVPVVACLLLAWALVADPITDVAGVIPLTLVCAFRVARGARWYEIALGGGVLASVGVAVAADKVIGALGGFVARPFSTQFAPLGAIAGHNLPIAARCLLLLPGSDFLDLAAGPGLSAGTQVYLAALHLAGAALATAGIAVAVWRFRRDDLVSQALLAGIVVTVAAFAVTPRIYGISSAREIAPVLPFAAALAGRGLARHLVGSRRPAGRRVAGGWLAGGLLARRAVLPALGVIAAGYLAGLGLELTAPVAPPQAAGLTAWLESHRLSTGLSGYWESSVVTLSSGNLVAVRPVTVSGDRVIPVPWQRKTAWYDPKRSRADFVVLSGGIDGYPGFAPRQAVLATFGEPARAYHVGRYTIWYWHRNLLEEWGDGESARSVRDDGFSSAGPGAGLSRRSRPAARPSVPSPPPRRWP